MLPEQVVKHRPNVLTEAQRAFYFEKGYLALPGYVPQRWVARLRAAMDELIERSRKIAATDGVYVLEEGHSAARPRLHRIASPQDQHADFWAFMADPAMTDLAADVVGPDVKFHHAKLNVKAGEGSRGFKWHQDIQSWPHTDYSPVTIGVYIDGCEADQGPLAFAPGTHEGPLYSMYDADGKYVVRVRDDEIAWLKEDMLDAPTGGPGTVTLLNCRTIHGSLPNRSPKARPLLLAVYSSADSFAYTRTPFRARIPATSYGASLRNTRASIPGRASCRPISAPATRPPGGGRRTRTSAARRRPTDGLAHPGRRLRV